MKKFKMLFLLVLVSLLILPVGVLAEEDSKEESKEVSVYFFRGEGCSHCAEAEAWFKSIEEEYGSKFEIKDYETWYSADNAALMEKVAKARKEEDSATGVPYIIIGDQSWIGFDASYEQEILDKINALYEADVNSRYDIMKLVSNIADEKEEEKKSNDVVSFIIVLVIFGGIGTGMYFARKKTA